MRRIVPTALVVTGPAPTWDQRRKTEPTCHCGLPVTAHSGDRCGICGQPVEHHTDAAALAIEIEGRARMAEARRHAGLPLTDVDAWCRLHVEHERIAA